MLQSDLWLANTGSDRCSAVGGRDFTCVCRNRCFCSSNPCFFRNVQAVQLAFHHAIALHLGHICSCCTMWWLLLLLSNIASISALVRRLFSSTNACSCGARGEEYVFLCYLRDWMTQIRQFLQEACQIVDYSSEPFNTIPVFKSAYYFRIMMGCDMFFWFS